MHGELAGHEAREQPAAPAAALAVLHWLGAINSRLSRWTLYIACACLLGLLAVVMYGVVMRYVFNNAPAYVEQLALLLVISVAMFGASAGVRDAGHIGLDSLVRSLPARGRFWCKVVAEVFGIAFAFALIAGGIEMAGSTSGATIPTLGAPEALRYYPVIAAGVLVTLFEVEHLLAQFTGRKVVPSWH